MKAFSIQKASSHFLFNPDTPITCIVNDREKECKTLSEAEEFFNNQDE